MNRDDFDDLPDDLRDALQREYPAPRVPAALDERVLAGARAHLARRTRRPVSLMRLFSSVAAAAAAVVIVGISVHFARLDNAPFAERSAAVGDDVNRDGRLDILDALAAAQGGAPQPDVDRLARAVVRVEVVQ